MIDPFDPSLTFEEKSLQIFEYQKTNNPVYQRFCQALGVNVVNSVSEIPLLPIQAFKDATLITEHESLNIQDSSLKFESSGTSGMHRSKHYVLDPKLYKESILKGMNHFYNLENYVVLAYTPGYAENPNSSLVWMLNTLIKNDNTGMSRFLPLGDVIVSDFLDEITSSGKKVMLFGAAFGLLDLIEMGSPSLPVNAVILETGGMKTHRREMTKEALHERLATGFNLPKESIHSEYGMTELLSQAYSRGSFWFECVPWMQVSIRNPQNPMEEMSSGEEGLIGVIDLANINSCSFILTGDKGVQGEDGKFQVLGRWNPINLRGCNFLIED
ncbi:MAG: hypothetical protein JJ895_10535 [Balneolaceae bacterium]|nr:hypothetical protein [Balneolaceae bacterium]